MFPKMIFFSSHYFHISLALLVVTLTQVKGKNEISCYQCNSIESSGRGELLDTSENSIYNCKDPLVDVANATACVISETIENCETVIVRRCGFKAALNGCVYSTKMVNGVTTTVRTCSCVSDGCNRNFALNGKGKNGISCYQCNSVENSGCGKHLNTSENEIFNCKNPILGPVANSTACLTVEKIVYGKTAVFRYCGHPNYQPSQPNGCIQVTQTVNGDITTEKMCSCDADGCNKDFVYLNGKNENASPYLTNFSPRQIPSGLGFASQFGFYITILIASFWLL